MVERDFAGAIDHFTTALDMKPGLVHALVSRGFCYLSLGGGGEAKAQRDFADVIAKDAGFNRNVYVLIALCFKRTGDFQTAIRYLGRCIVQFPAFKPALMARAELYLKVREYEKARMDFRQVLMVSPSHLAARRGLGDTLRGLGDVREAERHYTKAIEDATIALQEHGEDEYSAREEATEEGAAGSDEEVDSSSERINARHQSTETEDGGAMFGAADGEMGPSFAIDGVVSEASSDSGRPREGIRNAEREDLEEQFQEDGPEDAGSRLHGPENFNFLESDSVHGPGQLHFFLMEVLLRRALLLRIAGDLEGASTDLLEILQQNPKNGLALLWYGKLLIEQQRHKEAPAFLQASVQYREETQAPALALLGVLLLTRPDPDCEGAVRHLREAVKLNSRSAPLRHTQWICCAAAALKEEPHDARKALGFLDRTLAALGSAATAAAGGNSRGARTPPLSARGTVHVAGSGGAAVAGLTTVTVSKEESCWKTARAVVKRRQELAQGDDLELAFDCTTYLQLVAWQPAQQVAPIPPLLYALRAVALCDLGRYEEAATECRKVLSINPDDETTQHNMHLVCGILRSRASEYEAAVGRFTKAVRLRPVSAEARVHRAIALACAARARSLCSGAARDTDQAAQLLTDAVQDLEAAEQQALIVGTSPPRGTARLRAACLCGLGRLEEAWEGLRQAQIYELGSVNSDPTVAAHLSNASGCGTAATTEGMQSAGRGVGVLETEVLLLLGRFSEAIEACTALINRPGADKVGAYLARSRCWGELGEAERAFEDCREALVAAPERPDTHEASGELFLAHGCYNEALTAFNTAAKLRGSFQPRLIYLRAMSQLALGSASAALKDVNRTLRLNPLCTLAIRARDGVAALQMLLDGDYRLAHVRLNSLVHTACRQPNVAAAAGTIGAGMDGLSFVFQPHELVLYRGVCSMYLGEVEAAAGDFQTSMHMAMQFYEAEAESRSVDDRLNENSSLRPRSSGTSMGTSYMSESALAGASGRENVAPTGGGGSSPSRLRQLPPEIATREGLDCFANEMFFNMALCHLMAKDFRAATAICEKLLENSAALESLGPRAQSLAWFLLGVCRLAAEARGEAVRESFMASYAHDPIYVDDFLRRHGPRDTPSVAEAMGGATATGIRRVGGPSACGFRGSTVPPAPGAVQTSCDAVPDAVACLRRSKGALGARLPPKRVQVADVVIWCRASASWPFVRPPDLAPVPSTSGVGLPCGASLSRPDFLLDHDEVGVKAALPWDR